MPPPRPPTAGLCRARAHGLPALLGAVVVSLGQAADASRAEAQAQAVEQVQTAEIALSGRLSFIVAIFLMREIP